MNLYFIHFFVIPTKNNIYINDLKGAYVSYWVKDTDPESAKIKAVFDINKYDWEIKEILFPPTATSEKDFIGEDLENYQKATEEGIACIYHAWSKENSKKSGRFTLESSEKFDLNKYLKRQKKQKNKGRCLHHLSGERCNEFINAHSIQKNAVLSKIERGGKVYQYSKKMSDFNKQRLAMPFTLEGINRVSTFKGFCKKHDNELFEPIDNSPLIPNELQVFLYAYRSMSKEFFVKENSLNFLKEQCKDFQENKLFHNTFSDMRRGTEHAFNNLRRHKGDYDKSLTDNNYSDIRYTAFIASKPPILAFAGVLYPEFDFLGNSLQDLSNEVKHLDLITFSSAPLDSGWAFIFAWHKNSSKTCKKLMSSLATSVYEGNDLGDLLFRFVMVSCENIAISPNWWESLPEKTRINISEKASVSADLLTILPSNYLQSGLEGVSNWTFPEIFGNYK